MVSEFLDNRQINLPGVSIMGLIAVEKEIVGLHLGFTVVCVFVLAGLNLVIMGFQLISLVILYNCLLLIYGSFV